MLWELYKTMLHWPQESSMQRGIQLKLGSHNQKATNIFQSICNQISFTLQGQLQIHMYNV